MRNSSKELCPPYSLWTESPSEDEIITIVKANIEILKSVL